MRAEVAHTERKERETAPLGREVHAQSERSTIPSPFTKIHLVVVIDLTIMVYVYILQVAGPDGAAELALVGRCCNLSFALEEAGAPISPNTVYWFALPVLIGFNVILINLRGFRVIIGASKAE